MRKDKKEQNKLQLTGGLAQAGQCLVDKAVRK